MSPFYIVYLGEHDFDVNCLVDLVTSIDSVSYPQLDIWLNTIKDEMQFMKHDCVWELVELLEGYKVIGCKWLYETKMDSKVRLRSLKGKLVANDFT